MISTFGGFSMAKLGIRSSQQGLQITGNNISNINTDGYTRQRINQVSLYGGATDRYACSTDIRMGMGSLVTSISQIRDPFLDIRYRNEASNVGFYDEKLANLEELKAVLDEVSKDGIHTAFEGIRTQLNNLANNVGSKENDLLVRSSCEKLVSLLNKYAADLKTQKETSLQGFGQNVDEVNNILSQIQELNVEIRKSQLHGDPALEMLDNRNMLIDKLSEMTKIKVTYSEEKISEGISVNKLTIELDAPDQDPTNRPILIDGEFANKLEIEPLVNGKPDITAENYEVNLGGLTNPNGDTPIIAQIKQQMNTLNNLTSSMQGINQQLAGVTTKINNWKTEIGQNNTNFTENDFDHGKPDYQNKLKELQKEVDDARKAAQAAPNDQAAQKKFQEALEKQAAFKKFDAQKQNLDKNKADLEKQFDSKFASLQRNMKELDPTLTLNKVTNAANGTFSVQIDGGTPSLNNKTLIDGITPNSTPPKFDIKDNTTANPPAGIDLQLDGTKFGEKTLDELNLAANKMDIRENQWYGIIKADLQFLNGKGEFAEPDATEIRGIAYYQRSLDSLAQTFANTMNEANKPLDLQNGKPQFDAQGDPVRKDAPLFESNDPNNPDRITASNITISQGWKNGTTSITSSIDPGAVGHNTKDNTNILNMIAELSNKRDFNAVRADGTVIPGNNAPNRVFFNGSFEQMFTNMNAVLGSDMSTTSTLLNNYSIAANERAVARDNVSSVDLNEEGINLVQYQKSFAAACRVMTTMDEMLDNLLNVKR